MAGSIKHSRCQNFESCSWRNWEDIGKCIFSELTAAVAMGYGRSRGSPDRQGGNCRGRTWQISSAQFRFRTFFRKWITVLGDSTVILVFQFWSIWIHLMRLTSDSMERRRMDSRSRARQRPRARQSPIRTARTCSWEKNETGCKMMQTDASMYNCILYMIS